MAYASKGSLVRCKGPCQCIYLDSHVLLPSFTSFPFCSGFFKVCALTFTRNRQCLDTPLTDYTVPQLTSQAAFYKGGLLSLPIQLLVETENKISVRETLLVFIFPPTSLRGQLLMGPHAFFPGYLPLFPRGRRSHSQNVHTYPFLGGTLSR